MPSLGEIYPFQALRRPQPSRTISLVGVELQREHHILLHRHAIEERPSLEEHARLPLYGDTLTVGKRADILPLKEQRSRIGLQQPREYLEHHGLARAALAYYQVSLPGEVGDAYPAKHPSAIKFLTDILRLNHSVVPEKRMGSTPAARQPLRCFSTKLQHEQQRKNQIEQQQRNAAIHHPAG